MTRHLGMEDTQKWVAGVGATVLVATLGALGGVLALNRADNNAIEERLGSKLDDLASKIDAQNSRLREVEIQAAVSTALARVAIDTGTADRVVRTPFPDNSGDES